MLHIVPRRESFNQLVSMLVDTSPKITGDAHIKCAPAARHDVDVVGSHWQRCEYGAGSSTFFQIKARRRVVIPSRPRAPKLGPRFEGFGREARDLGMSSSRRM